MQLRMDVQLLGRALIVRKVAGKRDRNYVYMYMYMYMYIYIYTGADTGLNLTGAIIENGHQAP